MKVTLNTNARTLPGRVGCVKGEVPGMHRSGEPMSSPQAASPEGAWESVHNPFGLHPTHSDADPVWCPCRLSVLVVLGVWLLSCSRKKALMSKSQHGAH